MRAVYWETGLLQTGISVLCDNTTLLREQLSSEGKRLSHDKRVQWNLAKGVPPIEVGLFCFLFVESCFDDIKDKKLTHHVLGLQEEVLCSARLQGNPFRPGP